MQMQTSVYFRKTYGNARSITVMHRMRTWYNQQAKKAAQEHDTLKVARMNTAAAELTKFINADKANKR